MSNSSRHTNKKIRKIDWESRQRQRLRKLNLKKNEFSVFSRHETGGFFFLHFRLYVFFTFFLFFISEVTKKEKYSVVNAFYLFLSHKWKRRILGQRWKSNLCSSNIKLNMIFFFDISSPCYRRTNVVIQ